MKREKRRREEEERRGGKRRGEKQSILECYGARWMITSSNKWIQIIVYIKSILTECVANLNVKYVHDQIK